MGFITDNSQKPVQLNPNQLSLVELPINQHAALLGAAGTGKTTTLVELIAKRVLQDGLNPSEILVLTPDRRSATALRDQITLRLGKPTPGPMARSVGSFAFEVVNLHRIANGAEAVQLMTGAEQDRYFSEILTSELDPKNGDTDSDYWPEQISPEIRELLGFRTELRDLWMRCLEYGVDPISGLNQLADAAQKPVWQAAAKFFAKYQQLRKQRSDLSLDSAELIIEATSIIQSDTLPPNSVAKRLKLLILDDAQESLESTSKLVRVLAQQGTTVIAAGDPDISTASFRGALPDFLARMAVYLASPQAAAIPVTTVVLSDGYRLPPTLQTVTDLLSANIGTAAAGSQRRPTSQNLTAPNSPAAVSVQLANSASVEHSLVAGFLQRAHLEQSIPWNDMAVIVRSSALVPELARGLAGLDVPVRMENHQGPIREQSIVLAMLRAVRYGLGEQILDESVVTELFLSPLGGLDQLELRRLRRMLLHLKLQAKAPEQPLKPGEELAPPHCSEQPEEELAPPHDSEQPGEAELTAANTLAQLSVTELLVATLTDKTLQELLPESKITRKVHKLAKILESLQSSAAAGAALDELLWLCWSSSQLAEAWAESAKSTGISAAASSEAIDAVLALFTMAGRFVDRSPNSNPRIFIDHLLASNLPEDNLAPKVQQQAVTILTPQAAIATSFRVVAIASVQEGVWPNPRLRDSLLGAGNIAEIRSGTAQAELSQTDYASRRLEVIQDELRMLVQSISRASEQVQLSSVFNEETGSSPFLQSIIPVVPDHPLEAEHPRISTTVDVMPYTLRGLTGSLRRRLHTAESTAEKRAAAQGLAKLAQAGVSGAAPKHWYGIAEISSTEPLADLNSADSKVPVSPSKLESFQDCELNWVLSRLGADRANEAAQLGSIMHKVLEEATEFSIDSLWQSVTEQMRQLDFPAEWVAEISRNKARKMTNLLARYLQDFEKNGGEVLAKERRFQLDLGIAKLSGSIDRIERYNGNSIYIVDLKTGAMAPKVDEANENMQLKSYLLAAASGVLADVSSQQVQGAKLVIIGGNRANVAERSQAKLSEQQLTEFANYIQQSAEAMAGNLFVAKLSSHCSNPNAHGNCKLHTIGSVSC